MPFTRTFDASSSSPMATMPEPPSDPRHKPLPGSPGDQPHPSKPDPTIEPPVPGSPGNPPVPHEPRVSAYRHDQDDEAAPEEEDDIIMHVAEVYAAAAWEAAEPMQPPRAPRHNPIQTTFPEQPMPGGPEPIPRPDVPGSPAHGTPDPNNPNPS